ncbi:MAG: hypothetical protein O7B26_07995 [Planctomycetota bacterium]|nr:hypothetical protein [Planctomycetota bacterium]
MKRRTKRVLLAGSAITILLALAAIAVESEHRVGRFYAFVPYHNALRHYVYKFGVMPHSLADLEGEYNRFDRRVIELPSPPDYRSPTFRPVHATQGGPYLVLIEPKPQGLYDFTRFVIYADAKGSVIHHENVWEWELDDLIKRDDLSRAELQPLKNMNLEAQLGALAEHGIRLLPDRTVDELLISFSREDYESDPYSLLLTVMGSDVEEDPWGRRFSDDIWHFDTKCIFDHGAYVEIARRMQTLANGDLPIENLRDHVDTDGSEAWLEFELKGRRERFEPEVNDGWVDPMIFSWFVKMLASEGSTRRFIYCDLGGGQDCLIGCATEQELERLRRLTGQNFEWLW